MFIVFPLTVFMGSTLATPILSKKRPSGNLLSLGNVANVLLHMILCAVFQIIVFKTSQTQSVRKHTETHRRGVDDARKKRISLCFAPLCCSYSGLRLLRYH